MLTEQISVCQSTTLICSSEAKGLTFVMLGLLSSSREVGVSMLGKLASLVSVFKQDNKLD